MEGVPRAGRVCAQLLQNQQGRFSVGVTAIVRVTTEWGNSHEDVGFGGADNMPSAGQALEKAKKHAVTDARKRALRLFGEVLGNCLRSEDYQTQAKRARTSDAGGGVDTPGRVMVGGGVGGRASLATPGFQAQSHAIAGSGSGGGGGVGAATGGGRAMAAVPPMPPTGLPSVPAAPAVLRVEKTTSDDLLGGGPGSLSRPEDDTGADEEENDDDAILQAMDAFETDLAPAPHAGDKRGRQQD
jgi:hypothetical protein